MLPAQWESYNNCTAFKKLLEMCIMYFSYVSNITNLSVEEKMILYHTANLKTPLQHCLCHIPEPSIYRHCNP